MLLFFLILGFARTDAALIMQFLLASGIITQARLVVRSSMFKDTLHTCDKGDWYPIIHENSFANKLPGTIAQNCKWIQYLSLMLFPELEKDETFLKSKYWRLFLLLKNLCEFLLAPKLSDFQVEQQTKLLHEYLEIRLSLIDEDDVCPISPKHLFATHYDEIIRSVGCLAWLHTNRFEVECLKK